MDSQIHSRATGKLRKTSHKSFGDIYQSKKGTSTIYTIGDTTDNSSDQFPTGRLSTTQKQFIESFLQGITPQTQVDVDAEQRAVHWIGMWLATEPDLFVSCSLLQPQIANGKAHLSKVPVATIQAHAAIHFPPGDRGAPHISVPYSNPQLSGKFAIPLADSLIQAKILDRSNVQWSLVVLCETQPIFTLTGSAGIYSCKLTHASCKILQTVAPAHVAVISTKTQNQNYGFRSRAIVEGGGTGPVITIHKSGILQYQGKPEHACEVGRCFKDCIDTVMASASAGRFLQSLAVVNKALLDSTEVS